MMEVRVNYTDKDSDYWSSCKGYNKTNANFIELHFDGETIIIPWVVIKNISFADVQEETTQ